MPDMIDRLRTALSNRDAIERELGSGGMATVYLAQDLKHRRQVAIKVLRPELTATLGPERFVREIEIAANLNHPHILALFDSGEADGFLYYVMPFVEGESLRDRLKRDSKLSVPDAVRITDQVASALSHAHERGIVHRDIKPENILLAGDQAIVVLPFENLSPDPDQEYFSDGLTEELIADLSKVRALHVISRTSAMLLKGSQKDMPTIARELNVRYVLEGSVRWAGNNLRITAQLIEAATDAHLWAEKYSGTLEDVFDLQEQLSRSIVEALKVTLTPDEDRHLASRDIPDAEAYAFYVRARQEFQKFTEGSLDLAEKLVERALARTGPNALLLATAAEIAYAFQDMGYRPAAETLDRGDALATRALELDPNLAEAHVAKGLIAQRRFDIPATVRHALRAVELDPANAMAAWAAGLFLAEVGRTDEAREHGDRALDPLWWPAQAGSFYADLCDGDYDSALAKIIGMHTVSGDNPVADLWLGVCLVYAGRSDEAAAPLDRAAAAGVGIFSVTATCLGAMVSGDREAMRAVLADPGTRDALEMATELTWLVAAASAAVGDLDEALYWLSRAIEMGFINHRFFAEVDPFLAKLRGDPRFEELMERASAKQREIEAEA
jgi:TolB-like protein